MKTILVGKYKGGVGCSDIVANLAVYLNRFHLKGKIAIISFDFGSLALTSLFLPAFGRRGEKTLAHYLNGEADVDEIIYPIYEEDPRLEPLNGILLIPSGKPEDFADLPEDIESRKWDIYARKLQRLKEVLREEGVEVVLIDGPAAALEAHRTYKLLLSIADGFIGVGSTDEETNIRSLADLVALATVMDIPVLAVVLNKFKPGDERFLALIARNIPEGEGKVIVVPYAEEMIDQHEAFVPAATLLDPSHPVMRALESLAEVILEFEPRIEARPLRRIQRMREIESLEEPVEEFEEPPEIKKVEVSMPSLPKLQETSGTLVLFLATLLPALLGSLLAVFGISVTNILPTAPQVPLGAALALASFIAAVMFFKPAGFPAAHLLAVAPFLFFITNIVSSFTDENSFIPMAAGVLTLVLTAALVRENDAKTLIGGFVLASLPLILARSFDALSTSIPSIILGSFPLGVAVQGYYYLAHRVKQIAAMTSSKDYWRRKGASLIKQRARPRKGGKEEEEGPRIKRRGYDSRGRGWWA